LEELSEAPPATLNRAPEASPAWRAGALLSIYKEFRLVTIPWNIKRGRQSINSHRDWSSDRESRPAENHEPERTGRTGETVGQRRHRFVALARRNDGVVDDL